MNVKIMPVYIFLLRDGESKVPSSNCMMFISGISGTVLTLHEDSQLTLTAPITERLRQRDTGLRATADASLLVESLLDLGTCDCCIHSSFSETSAPSR